jgi:hypothetical protein
MPRIFPELSRNLREVTDFLISQDKTTAMSAYSVFLAVTGYDYHGPKGRLGFGPKLSPNDFRATFTAAEGWGTFEQTQGSKNSETQSIGYLIGNAGESFFAFSFKKAFPPPDDA